MKNIKKVVLLSSMTIIFAITSGCSGKTKISTVYATNTPVSSTTSVSTMAPESTPLVSIIPETVKPSESVDEAYQTAVKKDVEDFVKNAYNSFYTINSIQLITSEYSVKNNVLKIKIHVALNKTLKAETAEDIPYVKGMINKLNKLKAAKDSNVTAAEKIINAKINVLSEYIGTAADQNDFFRMTVKVINGELDLKKANFEFANGNDWIPATAFIPVTEATMMQNGEDDLTAALKQ
jgi:RNA polymerase sigma-70 factor (ECF subfamily)